MEFTTGHLEDAMTKVIKLLANLSTEEQVALDAFRTMRDMLSKFIMLVCEAVDRRNIESNEEFILNAISCVTNILYYDTAQDPLFDNVIREKVFKSFKNFLLATANEEI